LKEPHAQQTLYQQPAMIFTFGTDHGSADIGDPRFVRADRHYESHQFSGQSVIPALTPVHVYRGRDILICAPATLHGGDSGHHVLYAISLRHLAGWN
jgi:hypothetical protein